MVTDKVGRVDVVPAQAEAFGIRAMTLDSCTRGNGLG